MPNPEQDNQEIYDFYQLITKAFKKIMDCWLAKEGDIELGVRDDKGRVKAFIKGGPTDRIGKTS